MKYQENGEAKTELEKQDIQRNIKREKGKS